MTAPVRGACREIVDEQDSMGATRVAIIGNAGAGKSTLARCLAARHELPLLDLDTVAWMPGALATARPVPDAIADIHAFCTAHASWVVEGCYANLVAATLAFRPTLLFLDPGVERCIANCTVRPWEPHKYATRAEQAAALDFLLTWVREYELRKDLLSRSGHETLFTAYDGPKHWLKAMPDAGFVLPTGG